MPSYIVEVRDRTGKFSKEKVDALSPEQARSLLKNKYPAIGKVRKAGLEIDLSQLEMALSNVSI